jgi:hypothetical protein
LKKRFSKGNGEFAVSKLPKYLLEIHSYEPVEKVGTFGGIKKTLMKSDCEIT